MPVTTTTKEHNKTSKRTVEYNPLDIMGVEKALSFSFATTTIPMVSKCLSSHLIPELLAYFIRGIMERGRPGINSEHLKNDLGVPQKEKKYGCSTERIILPDTFQHALRLKGS